VLTTKEQLVSPLPSVQNGARRPLWQTLGLSALSGLLLAGSLPHLDWGWLAWFGLVPLLLCFPFPNRRTAFWHGFTLGIFYLGVMAYWLIVFAGHIIGPALSVVGWALVTAYQAFYLGVWAVGVQWLRKQPNPWAWRLGTPALWAIVEWWRQSGALGLGWGDLAYTQHLALPILQVTKLTGIWGLAFLIVLVNVALAERVRAWGKRKEAPLPQFWGARERPDIHQYFFFNSRPP
jgi:apolipoprotein N-acyltransferase